MNKKTIFTTILWIVCLCLNIQTKAQERVFAGYFDIPINSPEGTEVIGRIHLERNKDVHTCPIPEGYHLRFLNRMMTLFSNWKHVMTSLSELWVYSPWQKVRTQDQRKVHT